MRLPAIQKKAFVLTCLVVALVWTAGCSFLVGSEESESTPPAPFQLNYIETLRNQESLRGESFQEIPRGSVSAPFLQRPSAVYADQYRVYVADSFLQPPAVSSARVFVFERGSLTATLVNISPSPDGPLLAPAGIAVDASGVIYLSDKQQGRVVGFDRNGALVTVLGRPQSPLTSRGGLADLSAPGSLAFDNARNILYVADTRAHQVKAFNSLGAHLFDLGNSGRSEEDFKFPAGLAVDRNGNVYVLDSFRLRVFIFNEQGKYNRNFSLKGAVPGQSIRPSGLGVDSDGHIYVTDEVNSNILIFNPDGSLVLTWGRTGRLSGDFWTPTAIFIDSQNYIYIADQTNSRVQTFQYTRQ